MIKYLGCISVYLLGIVFAGQVCAHAVLEETQPANGAVLSIWPEEMLLRFNEPVTPIRLQLLDSSGQVIATEVDVVDNELHIAPLMAQKKGQYLLSYRVLSLDALPVAGIIGFAVGDMPAPIVPELIGADATTLVLTRIIRTCYLTALLASVGLVLFPLIFTLPAELEPHRRRCLVVTTTMGIASGILGLGLWGVLLAEVPLSAIFQSEVWLLANSTTLAISTALMVLGSVGILISISFGPGLPGNLLGRGSALVSIASLGTSGHAASAVPAILTPVFVLHALMAGLWFGALWLLFSMVSQESVPSSIVILRQFSRRATWMVVALLACAGLLVWHQFDSLTDLFNSDYGYWLLIKLGLVTLVLLLAAANRWRYVPALELGGTVAILKLRKAIGIEIALMVVIIAVTTVLASSPPPVKATQQLVKTVTLE